MNQKDVLFVKNTNFFIISEFITTIFFLMMINAGIGTYRDLYIYVEKFSKKQPVPDFLLFMFQYFDVFFIILWIMSVVLVYKSFNIIFKKVLENEIPASKKKYLFTLYLNKKLLFTFLNMGISLLYFKGATTFFVFIILEIVRFFAISIIYYILCGNKRDENDEDIKCVEKIDRLIKESEKKILKEHNE